MQPFRRFSPPIRWFSLTACLVSLFCAQLASGSAGFIGNFIAEALAGEHRAALTDRDLSPARQETRRAVRSPAARETRNGAPPNGIPRETRNVARERRAMRDRLNSGVVGIIFGGMDDADFGEAIDLGAVIGNPDIKILSVAGNGAKQTVTDLLFTRAIDVAIVQADVLAAVKQHPPFPDAEHFLEYITKLYDEEIHILAQSDIHSLQDLQDKRVNFGTFESGTYSSASAIFQTLGIPVQTTDYAQPLALDKLRRGEISAMVYTAGKPARLFQSVRPEEGLHFLPIPPTVTLTAYTRADLSADDYPGLIEQGEPIATLAVGTVLVVYNWPARSERYRRVARFVEAFFQQMDQLRFPPYHPKWREVDIGAQIPGWTRFAAASQYIKSTGEDTGEPVPGAGSTQQPGSIVPTGAGGDPPTSPTASTSPVKPSFKARSPSDDNEALFRDFVEYQKTVAAPIHRPSDEPNSRKLLDDPEQKAALFADFQAHVNALAPNLGGTSAAKPRGE
jgi:TRAP-type uncharacterized transport system substrate-binding protein